MFDSKRINLEAFSYYRRLRQVKSFVEKNLDQPISAGQAARIAGLSPGYFCTFFREKTGVRFGSWVTYLRVEAAKQYLCRRNESITQLAYSTGFAQLRTFERSFKSYTGQTPRDFKRRHRPS